MCGIVGIIGDNQVCERLVEGLKRLEYRGYDSAGIALLSEGRLERRRAEGKISNLQRALDDAPCDGNSGIAHTRWATHGKPSEDNAHPHVAGPIAIVHNGIIENFRELRDELKAAGHTFVSQTDSEVIAHLIYAKIEGGASTQDAFFGALQRLRGAFAVAAINSDEPERIYAAREGSPLVVGIGQNENFVGSDSLALAGWTRQVIYLEEGDWCVVSRDTVEVYDASGAKADREVKISNAVAGFADKGAYRHFMEKEIHEQPDAIGRTLSNYIDAASGGFHALEGDQWKGARRLLASACGTAYFAISVSRYWFERHARLPVEADIASEFRYREPVLTSEDRALFVSQSGETADTLAALRYCKSQGAGTVAVVNVPESSIAREADQIVMTHAGPEIGVASTKAFTAQLAALACIACGAAVSRGTIDDETAAEFASALLETPRRMNEVLGLQPQIEKLAHRLSAHRDVLYLGRGAFYPLALEGALKLKEISYIHAEGYAAGELKHGPIALIEDGTPVVVVAPHDGLFEKTLSNLQEVAARGAEVILITDERGAKEAGDDADHILVMPTCHPLIQPIVAAVPIQQLAYFTAVLKGTDVDQPRNLAKSVTVE
ncbi:MAG: glutamine--fructose-6-phosphate transaminase (isomerizing) [Oceanicaulis sp.]